jgi:hypothetical protein
MRCDSPPAPFCAWKDSGRSLPYQVGTRQYPAQDSPNNRRACPINSATGDASTLSEQKSLIALLLWVTWGVLPSLQ